MNLVDSKRLCDLNSRTFPVSGQHHRLGYTGFLDLPYGFLRACLHRVADHDISQVMTVQCCIDDGPRLFCRLCVDMIRCHERQVSNQKLLAIQKRFDSMSCSLLCICHSCGVKTRILTQSLPDRPGNRVIGIALSQCRSLKKPALRLLRSAKQILSVGFPGRRNNLLHPELSLCQRPRLVKDKR